MDGISPKFPSLGEIMDMFENKDIISEFAFFVAVGLLIIYFVSLILGLGKNINMINGSVIIFAIFYVYRAYFIYRTRKVYRDMCMTFSKLCEKIDHDFQLPPTKLTMYEWFNKKNSRHIKICWKRLEDNQKISQDGGILTIRPSEFKH